MSNPRAAQPAADRSLDALRSYLSDTAQRELDALRAALDIRLAALEDALAHPDQGRSLEDLVLDLARVATAEAESSAARAVLDAQLHAHERAAAVSADALRSLAAEREITNTLRHALEQAGTAVDVERAAGVRLGRENDESRLALESERRSVASRDHDLEQARAALLTERQAGVALHRGVEEAQSALKSERARSAALDAELGEERQAKMELAEALAGLQRELAAAAETHAAAAESHAAADAANRSDVEDLERRYADLDRTCGAALEQAEKAGRERDALAAELDAARQTAMRAQAAVDTRLEAINAERAHAERASKEAEARAQATIRERDALAAELDAARQTAMRTQAAVEARLDAINAERAHTERGSKDAEARAQVTIRERDALAAELDVARQALRDAQGASDERLAAIEAERVLTERALKDAEAHAGEAIRERDALAAELDAARQAAHDAQVAADERLAAIEAERLQTERALRDAELHMREAIGERDALTAELDAAQRASQDSQGAADVRQEAIEAERVRTEQAWMDAEARAEQAVRERDGLAAELESGRQALHDSQTSADTRLEAIEAERVRSERAAKDADARAEEATRARDALAAELDAARQAAGGAQAVVAARLETIDVERTHTEQAVKDAEARAGEAIGARDALAAELDAARQAILDMQAAVDARLEAIDAERVQTEQAWKDAETRDEAIRERDALAAELDAARQDMLRMQAAVDARLEQIADKRARTVKALKDAEAREEDAIRERDALAAELAAARQTAPPDAQHAQQLEAAADRIRALEFQLFERGREPHDRDVELLSMLDAPSPPPGQPVRKATRYSFSATIEVHVDGNAGVLVNLSVGGAQVLCPRELEVDRVAIVSLLSDEIPVSCQGTIVWSSPEPLSEDRPPTWRAGISFTDADEAAVEAFIIRYSAS